MNAFLYLLAAQLRRRSPEGRTSGRRAAAGQPAVAQNCEYRRKDGVMEAEETFGDRKAQREEENDAVSQLHVRQVQDRALPARTVLTQQRHGSERDAPSPLFVP